MNQQENTAQISQEKCRKGLTIFCGVSEYDNDALMSIKGGTYEDFQQWEFHVNPNKMTYEEILKVFHDMYYDSVICSLFPDFNTSQKSLAGKNLSEQTIRCTKHLNIDYTLKLIIDNNESEKIIKVEYIDLYLFPDNIAFYCFKCSFDGYSYSDISLLNNHIRNEGVNFPFVRDNISNLTYCDSNEMLVFGNKLKLFTLIEMDQELSNEQESNLLYELATSSPIGTVAGKDSYYKPSLAYYKSLIDNNTLNVFDNWKGMGLFDSFTGLFRIGVLNNFIWENAYFNLIFLNSVYIKHYLFKTNKKFYLADSDKQKLENEFYEFDKHFNFDQISFNFLPQLIYDKVRFGLDIEDELVKLKTSIERANSIEKNRRDKNINDVLTIIAFLTVFSIIWDVSEWIDKLFFDTSRSYYIISISLTVCILTLIGIFVVKNFIKKKSKWKA